MSIKVMTVAWEISRPHADKLLLIALADQANDEGWCWPSVATLGRKCGMEDRSIRRVIARLVKGGHVTVQQRRQTMDDGRVLNTSNNYRVHPAVAGTEPPDSGSVGTKGHYPPDGKSVPPGRKVRSPRTKGQGGTDPRSAKSSSNPLGSPH
jgi:hypothetical protein